MSSLTSSQLMKPYRRRTLMGMKWVRRMIYGRGHGIHSPLAYALVYSIVRPFGRYYDYDLVEEFVTPEALLWYRILARMCPSEVHYRIADKRQTDLLQLMQRLAVLRLHPSGTALLATDEMDEAVSFLGLPRQSLVLLAGVRRTKSREKDFISCLESDVLRGIVLDLYDSAILLNNNDELYYYRTTL